MFNTGADKVNFKILIMLPTDVNKLMKELNLTKMPVNTRVNELEKVGLVKRLKGTGKIISTDMTKDFLALIEAIRVKVEESIRDQLSDLKC